VLPIMTGYTEQDVAELLQTGLNGV
jgi:hypothetical protein